MIFSGNFPTINGFVRFSKNNNLSHEEFLQLYFEIIAKKPVWSIQIPNFSRATQEHLINESHLAVRRILKSLKPSISTYLEKKLSINFNNLVRFIRDDENDFDADHENNNIVKLIDLVYNLEANPNKKELHDSMILSNIRFDVILTSNERRVFSLLVAGMKKHDVLKECRINEAQLNGMVSHALMKNNWITSLMVPITRKYFFSSEEFLIMSNYYTHVVDNIYVLNKFWHHAESMLNQLKNNLINSLPVKNDFFTAENVKNYFRLTNYEGHWISVHSGQAAVKDIMKFKGTPFTITDEFINELFKLFHSNGLMLSKDYIKELLLAHTNEHQGQRVTEDVVIVNEDEYDLCKNDFMRNGFVFVKKHAHDSILQNIWDRLCDELNVHNKARYQAYLSNSPSLTIHHAVYDLFKDGEFTRKELEDETGLSESTITNLVGETIVKTTKLHYKHVFALKMFDNAELADIVDLINKQISARGEAQINQIVTGRDAIEEIKYKLKKKFIFKENIAFALNDFVPTAKQSNDNYDDKKAISKEIKEEKEIETVQADNAIADKAKAKTEVKPTPCKVYRVEDVKAAAKKAQEKAEKEAKLEAKRKAQAESEENERVLAEQRKQKDLENARKAEAAKIADAEKLKELAKVSAAAKVVEAGKKVTIDDLDFDVVASSNKTEEVEEVKITADDFPEIKNAKEIHEQLHAVNEDGSKHLIQEDLPEVEPDVSLDDLPSEEAIEENIVSDEELMNMIQEEALMAEIAIMANEADKADEANKMTEALNEKKHEERKEQRNKTQLFFTKAPKTRLVYEDNSSVIHEDEEYEDGFDDEYVNDDDFELDDVEDNIAKEKEAKAIKEKIEQAAKDKEAIEKDFEEIEEDLEILDEVKADIEEKVEEINSINNVSKIIDIVKNKFKAPFTQRELVKVLDFEPTEEEFREFLNKKCINILGSSNGSVFELKDEYK